jgi:protein TonB
MFDTYKGAKTAKRPKWVGALLTVSIALHALGVIGLLVRGIWMIDKLAVPETRLELAISAPPPPPPPKGGGQKAPDTLKDKIKKVRTKETVQPVQDAEEPDPESTVDAADVSDDFGVEGGVEGGVAGGVVGGVLGGVVGGDIGAAPPPPPEPEKPKVVPQVALKANRISGNDQVAPPESVRLLMVKQGESKLVATSKMCLTKAGAVASVNMVKSSGYAEYDQKILAEMRRWKYRPFTVNGKAVPVCTAITFIYRMQ